MRTFNRLLVCLLCSSTLLFAGCRRKEPAPIPPQTGMGTAPAPSEGKAPLEQPPPEAEPAPELDPVEACVDRWLEGKNLDRYGHPAGTMYTGGTPLFDERTGETTDRLEYVFGRHPEAKAACAPDAGGGVETGKPTR